MSLIPTEITLRGLQPSGTLESAIRERVQWLGRFYGGIVRCCVLVEFTHRHAGRGRRFHVRIELTVGDGAPIVVSHDRSPRGPAGDDGGWRHKPEEIAADHADVRVAVHDAFDAARRLLEDFARRQRHTHHDPHHGRRRAARSGNTAVQS